MKCIVDILKGQIMSLQTDAKAEDNLIEHLQTEIANLKRANSNLKNRFNVDLEAAGKDMYSIDEWCHKNSMSKVMFYKLVKEKKVPLPVSIHGLRRQFIRREDDEAWRKDVENFEKKTFKTNIKFTEATPR